MNYAKACNRRFGHAYLTALVWLSKTIANFEINEIAALSP